VDIKRFRNYLLGRGFSPDTIYKRIGYLKRVTIDLDKVAKGKIDKYEVADWLHKQTGLGDGAKNNFVKAINSYFEYKEFDYRLKLKYKRGDPDIQIPTPQEAERLKNTTLSSPFKTNRARLLLETLFMGGLRWDEARKLKYSDFRETPEKEDPSIRYYHINVIGKGNKRRLVIIPQELYRSVMHYRRYYGSCEFVFDNGKGRPISLNHVGRISKETAIAVEVPHFHPHAARHYRTVELDEQGISIETIRRFLGHSKLSTTQGYLRGRRTRTRDEIIQKDKHFSGLRTKKERRENTPGERSYE